jgi:hypothetical protein
MRAGLLDSAGIYPTAAAHDPAALAKNADKEQTATRRSALEDITGHSSKGSSNRAALGLQCGGDIPVRIGDGAHARILGITGQVYRFPGDALTDGHFRAERDEINTMTQRVDQPVMSLVTAVVAYRLAEQAAADGRTDV